MKKYHHGNLRRALLDAALELVEERGPHGVSMREAARRAGVSSGAPYKHFADQTALMKALAEEGYERMSDQINEAVARAGEEPLDRFRAMGVAYVQFAVANPAYFRVVNIAEFSPPDLASRDEYNAAIAHILASQRAGTMYRQDPQVISLAAQCLVHGLARMFVDGQMSMLGIGPDQASAIAIAITEVLGHGLLPR